MKINRIILIIAIIFSLQSSLFAGSGIWKSLIVPGWGEKQLDYDKRGNLLLFAEFALWAGLTYSNDQYSSYKNSYINHGQNYAGVNWINKNDLYAANVGNYTCLSYDDCGDEAYNEIIRKETFGNDIGYPETEEYKWNWENRTERLRYDTWRNKSKNYNDIKGFIVGGMILNRIISVIDVVILERKNKLSSQLYRQDNDNMMLKIFYNF